MAVINLKCRLNYATYCKLRELLPTNRCLHWLLQQQISTIHSETEKRIEKNNADTAEAPVYNQPLYEGHRPTSMFQKVLLSTGSAAMSLLDPFRGDMVATLGDVTGYRALKYVKKKMEEDEVGQQILSEQPIINTNTISIDYLGSLPKNTFGKEYWRFLTVHGFSPDARLPVHFVDDPELMYVMLRYRQCHDLFHTILGMKPNMLGEVVVKWVEAIQTGLPMCVLAAAFGPIRLGPKHRKKYVDTYLPWAIRNGQNSKMLMCVYFEKYWEYDLEEMRRHLNIEPPPVNPYPS